MKTVYSKAVYKLRGDKLASFLKQESDMLQESPRKRDLRSRLESSAKDSRELKRKLDSSFEEIEKLGAELDSVTDHYNKNIRLLSRSEQQYGLIIEKLLQERNMDKQLKDKYLRQLTEMQELCDENKEALLENELEVKNKKIKSLSMTLSRRDDTKRKDKVLIKNRNQEAELQKMETEMTDLHSQLTDKDKEITSLKKESNCYKVI